MDDIVEQYFYKNGFLGFRGIKPVWSERKRTEAICFGIHGRRKAWEKWSCIDLSFRFFFWRKGVFELEFLLENKWVILVCLEVLAWTSTFFLLYARYRLKSSFWFKVATALFALTGVIPQVLMGIINFISTKRIDLFTLIIVLLLLYGFTIGKQHVKRLDAWAQTKFSKQST